MIHSLWIIGCEYSRIFKRPWIEFWYFLFSSVVNMQIAFIIIMKIIEETASTQIKKSWNKPFAILIPASHRSIGIMIWWWISIHDVYMTLLMPIPDLDQNHLQAWSLDDRLSGWLNILLISKLVQDSDKLWLIINASIKDLPVPILGWEDFLQDDSGTYVQ